MKDSITYTPLSYHITDDYKPFYEDIYNRINRIKEDWGYWYVVCSKWRRLSLLIDKLLYMIQRLYTKPLIKMRSKHVRGSRRSDL
jgi:hypothetical protein